MSSLLKKIWSTQISKCGKAENKKVREQNHLMIIDTIETYLKNRPNQERATHCFHPSSLHKSPKELYWHYLGKESQYFPSRIKRIFDNGHKVHERIQDYLEEAKVLTSSETSVYNKEYEICGHADGIIVINNIKIVLEIKSINSRNFYSLFEPKSDHIKQANVYMYCLGIPIACILYECKDDQELQEFYISIDKQILAPILTKIKYVQNCIRKKEVPDNITF